MAGLGQLVRLRIKSQMKKLRVGYATPEHRIAYFSVAAPGAVGAVLFVAEAPCKLVSGRERHTTAGAGSSVISLRKHAAGTIAAPNAAVAAGITDVVDGGIPADATVNTWQDIVLDADEVNLATGDSLMLVTPATLAGVGLQLHYVYTGHPVG